MATREERARRPRKFLTEQIAHEAIQRFTKHIPLRLCWPSFFVSRASEGKPPVFVIVLKHEDKTIPNNQALFLREMVKCGLECYRFDPQNRFQRLELDATGRQLILIQVSKKDPSGEYLPELKGQG